MKILLKPLCWCENALGAIAGLLMILMMLLTAVDVVMRYAFNAPLSWAFDLLTQYMLVAAFFLSFSLALRLGEHVAVDFFVNKFHASHRRVALNAAWIMCALLGAVVVYTAAHEAFVAWKQGEVVAGVIPWPVWIQKAIVAIGMAPLTARMLLLGAGTAPLPSPDATGSSLEVALKG